MPHLAVHAEFINRAAEAIYTDQRHDIPFEIPSWEALDAGQRMSWCGRAFNTPYVTTMTKEGQTFHVVARLCEAYYIQFWDSRSGQWWGAMTRDRLSEEDARALRQRLWENGGNHGTNAA